MQFSSDIKPNFKAKTILLSILFALFCISGLAQTLNKTNTHLYPIPENGKWGYVDESGTIVIKPQFLMASDFHNSLASVAVGKKYGYINEAGKWVVKPQYDVT